MNLLALSLFAALAISFTGNVFASEDCIFQKKSVKDSSEPGGTRSYIVVAHKDYQDCIVSCHPRDQGQHECYRVHTRREELCLSAVNPIYRGGWLECDSAACGFKTHDGGAFECSPAKNRLGE